MFKTTNNGVPLRGYIGAALAVAMGLLVLVIDHWQAIRIFFSKW
jgi:hypothetical protein